MAIAGGRRMSKCEECDYRQLMAKVFDMHFDFLDCPKECEEKDKQIIKEVEE